MAIKFLNSVNADSGVLYVDANSNRVGIGTTSPAVGLDVRPLARFWHGSTSHFTQFSNGNEINTFNSSGGSTVMYLQYRSGSLNVGAGTLIVQSGNGNVGIGTTSPSHKLQVAGNIYANAGQIYIDNGYYLSGGDATSRIYLGNNGSQGVQIYTNSTERMRIADGGNVGIGTTTPENKLHILSSTTDATQQLLIQNGSSGDAAIKFNISGDTYSLGIDNSDGDKFKLSAGNLGTNDRIVVNSAGNVGIGSTNPTQSKLVVDGDISIPRGNSLVFLESITGAFRAKITSQNTFPTFNGLEFYTGGVSSAPKMIISENGNLQLNAYTAGLLKTDANGNVSLDTNTYLTSSSTQSKYLRSDESDTATGTITLADTSAAQIPLILGSSSQSTYTLQTFRTSSHTTNNAYIIAYGASHVSEAGNFAMKNTIGGKSIFFEVNNAVPLRLKTNESIFTGNVGIGTTSPGSILHMVGASPEVRIASSADGQTARLGLYEDTAGTQHGGYIKYVGSGDTLRLGIVNSGANTDVITVTDTFNVGIGTTSPTSQFTISDPTSPTLEFNRQGSTANGWIKTTDNSQNVEAAIQMYGNEMRFYTNGESNQRMVINSSGNVGIGTASPLERLHINGAIKLDQSANVVGNGIAHHTNGYLYVTGGTAGAAIGNDSYSSAVYAVDNGSLELYAGSSNRLHITSSGNVGIGTTSPAEKLHIYGTSVGIDIDGTTSSRVYYNRSGAYVWSTGLRSGDTKFHIFDERTGDRVVIDDSGNVGIGTTSPNRKLHVVDTNPQIKVSYNSATDPRYAELSWGGISVNAGDSANAFAIRMNGGNSSNGHINFFTGPNGSTTEKMRITQSGNVGIGTTSPSSPLTVAGRVDFQNDLRLRGTDSAANQGVTRFYVDSSNKFYIDTANDGNNKFVIDSTGNVGIGTTSPLYKLDVGGTIHVRGNSGTLIRTIGSNNTDQTIIRVSNSSQTDDGDYGFSIKYMGTRSGNLNSLSIFSDGQTAASQTEAITIAQDGIVGFTNASPTATVDIGGTLKASGAVTLSNYGAGYVKSDASGNLTVDNSVFQSQADADTRYVNVTGDTMTGDLTISKTTPILTFNSSDVLVDQGIVFSNQGNFDASIKHGASSADMIFDIGRNSTWGGAAIFKLDTYQSYRMFRDSHQWSVLGSEKMRVASNGNVGIGITSPSSKVHSKGEIRVDFNDTDGSTYVTGYGIEFERGTNYLRPRGSDGTQTLHFGSANDSLDWNNIHFKVSDHSQFRVAGSDIMRINSTGVGIGTTSPNAKLNVVGHSKFNGTNYHSHFNYSGDSSEDTYIRGGKPGAKVYINDSHNSNVLIASGGGNVGIGTTSPSEKLEVNGNIQASTYKISGVTVLQGSSIVTVGSGGGTGQVRLSTTSGVGLTLNGSNVGIGTTSPSQKLEVDGNVKADNFIGGNEAGIYTFNDTVNASASEDIFSISNEHGAQAFRVTFVCSTSGYSVAKTFEVVHSFGNDPVFFKVVDTGAYSANDFDVSFTNSNSDTGVTCEITNNSTTVNADIATTVFLGGSPTTITVTAL